jgi:hypothetical protein
MEVEVVTTFVDIELIVLEHTTQVECILEVLLIKVTVIFAPTLFYCERASPTISTACPMLWTTICGTAKRY